MFCSFSEVFQQGFWMGSGTLLKDTSLKVLMSELLHLQIGSKAPLTTRKYSLGWDRWRTWARSKVSVAVFPAHPLHMSLYLTHLCREAEGKGTSAAVLESTMYSNRWAHQLAGLDACPPDHPFVRSTLEGARRRLARPVQPKDPLRWETVREIAQRYSASNSLADIRFLAILLIGYAGCFRIREILAFTIDVFEITSDCMLIYLNKRKNDEFRQGHSSMLARTGNITCPVAATEKWLSKLPTGSSPRAPLIRRIVKSKSNEYFHLSKGVVYSTIRNEFKKYVKPFVKDIDRFCTHSMRSGSATKAARHVSSDLLDLHVGWRSSSSKNRYIEHNNADRLFFSKSLGL